MYEVISSTHQHLAFLPDARNEITNPVGPSLKRVVLVGSVYNGHDGFRLRDEYWVGFSREICSTLRVGWDKNFKLIPLNYINGEDVLDPALKVSGDVLVVCYVVDRDKSIDEGIKRMPPEMKHGFSDDTIKHHLKSPAGQKMLRDQLVHVDFNVSPHHSETAWREAARRIGARAIVTFGNKIEIDHTNFSGNEFKYLLSSQVTAPNSSNGGMCTYRMELVLREDLLQEVHRRNPEILSSAARL